MTEQAPAEWPNGCDHTVPKALRYLADHPRPIGGEEHFNSIHLYQLADEIECMAKKPLYLKPTENEAAESLAKWMMQNGLSTGHGDRFSDLLKELEWQLAELRQTKAKLRNEQREAIDVAIEHLSATEAKQSMQMSEPESKPNTPQVGERYKVINGNSNGTAVWHHKIGAVVKVDLDGDKTLIYLNFGDGHIYWFFINEIEKVD